MRGGLTEGVICWAEGETPEETRDRAKTICAALCGANDLTSLHGRIALIVDGPVSWSQFMDALADIAAERCFAQTSADLREIAQRLACDPSEDETDVAENA